MKFLGLKLTLADFVNTLPLVITSVFLSYYRNIKIVNVLASLAIGLMAMIFFHTNVLFANTICALSLLLITYYVPEGFMSSTPASISATVKKLKEGFETSDKKDDEEENFMNKDDEEEGYSSLKNEEEEGFMNMNSVFKNISTAGYTSPGFGIGAPLVEGFEDTKPKPETKSKPAPVAKKEEMAMPFKLGEIPSQVKNGPHIDASSTLMKAIHSLNPEQINAMTKDTKQLIETQKSLMGMLGTMKPMMNDGKELMETFQEMFGKQ
jgi:hypothetical protein